MSTQITNAPSNLGKQPVAPQFPKPEFVKSPSLATPDATWVGLMASKEIIATIKISRAHLYNLLARRQFPQPAIRSGTRFTRWKASEVQAWLNDPSGYVDANTECGVAA